MLLRTPRLALVGAGSVAPGTPLRILALTRSDRWWLGRPDKLLALCFGAQPEEAGVKWLERPGLLCNL